jgi:hypothetical protein
MLNKPDKSRKNIYYIEKIPIKELKISNKARTIITFYTLMPNKTLQLKGEKCHGGKKIQGKVDKR